MKTKTLLLVLLAALPLFAHAPQAKNNYSIDKEPMLSEDDPEVNIDQGNYWEAKNGDGNYLLDLADNVSAVPASFFVSDGEKVITREPLGKSAKSQPICICYNLVNTLDIAEMMDFSITYKNEANEFRKSKITIPYAFTAELINAENTIMAFPPPAAHINSYGFIFEPLSEDGEIYINNITLSLAQPAIYSHACVYNKKSKRSPSYLFFNQKIRDEEELTIVKDKGTYEIVSSPKKPILPAEIIDSFAFFDDDMTNLRYRAKSLDGSLEKYASSRDQIEAGCFYKVNICAQRYRFATRLLEATIIVKYEDDDTTPPTITVAGQESGANIEFSYKEIKDEPTLIQKIAAQVQITDDRETGLMPDIAVANFEAGKLGRYELTIRASDGINKALWEGSVSIIDDIAPQVTGPKIINASAEAPLTQEEILAYYSAVDEIDGTDLEMALTDNEYGIGENRVTAGDYALKVTAIDKSKNKGTLAVIIKVEEDDNEMWFVDGSTLTLVEGAKLSPMEIVRRLVDVGTIEDLDYQKADISKGPLMDGTLKPGEYEIALRVDTATGETMLIEMIIKVVAKSEDKEDKANWFVQFWLDLWDSIVSFFTGLFSAE